MVEERTGYMMRTVRRLWSDAKKRPVIEQLLGAELARKLASGLDAPSPWSKVAGQEHFLCELAHKCQLIERVTSALSTKPTHVGFDHAITALMLNAPDNEARQVLSVFKEHEFPAVIAAGTIEFCDTMMDLHTQLHGDGDGALIKLIALNIVRTFG